MALLVNGEQDKCVSDDDDKQRNQIHHDHPKDRVSRLPSRRRKRIVRHTLCVPGELRMSLHVEDVDLEKKARHRHIMDSPLGSLLWGHFQRTVCCIFSTLVYRVIPRKVLTRVDDQYGVVTCLYEMN